MIRYSVQPGDRIFIKGYGFLSFPKNMGKNIGKNIRKNFSGKYSPGVLAMCQKLLDHAKKSSTDTLKTSSKRVIQKVAEGTRDFVGTKIANKMTGISKHLQQNNSETVTTENGKEIIKERNVSLEER